MEASHQIPAEPIQAPKRRIAWLELFLLFAGEALFFQIFPGTWIRFVNGFVKPVLWTIDVRNWNIAGYIVGLSLVLIALVVMKIWRDRVEWDADLKRWSGMHKRRS